MEIKRAPSPIHSDRKGHKPTCTVIHYTGGAAANNDIRAALDPANGKSWHFIVDRDGTVTQQVDLGRAAWHAGKSDWKYHDKDTEYVNTYSIGIEIANRGPLIQLPSGSFAADLGNGKTTKYIGPPPVKAALTYIQTSQVLTEWWEPFTSAAIGSVMMLIQHIAKSGYPEAARDLLGHNECALPRGRKSDPGPLFPWHLFDRKRLPLVTSSARIEDYKLV